MSMDVVSCAYGSESPAASTRARRVLRAARRRREVGRGNRNANEGSRGPGPADHGGVVVGSEDAHLYMRLHRESRPHAADHLPSHGQAQRSGPCRIGEAWDLDLLPVGVDPRGAYATAAEPAHLLGCGGSRDQLAEELLDTDVDLFPDSAHRLQILAGRIVQLPVFISFAWIDRAGVTAAHRYHHVGRADVIVRQRFGKLSADVEPDLAHATHHTRIQRIPSPAPAQPTHYPTCLVTLEQRRRHLAPTRVVHAHEEHLTSLRLHPLQITTTLLPRG